MRLVRRQRLFRRRARVGCLSYSLSLMALAILGFFLWQPARGWLYTRLNPSQTAATVAAASQAYAHGDLERTIQLATALHQQSPDDALILELLVRALIYHSFVEYDTTPSRQKALDMTQAARAAYPVNNAIQGIHALALQANRENEAAADLAIRTLRTDARNLPARLALSLAYGEQGIFQAALREANAAIEYATQSNPDYLADAYRVQALAYSDLGQYDAAAISADRAIQAHRRLIPLYFERALYAVQVGDMDTATANYFSVIAFDEQNIKARFRLCETSSTLREHLTAVEYCREVTERAPGWYQGWYQLGREHYLSGNWRQARESLGRCQLLQIAQDIPIVEREIACWTLQGQAAEVLRDCPTLLAIYHDFKQMEQEADLIQSWVYPPDGPTICVTPSAP